MTHTLNSEWSHVKENSMLSVYWTPLRHPLTSRTCCATRVTILFGGALCNGDEVYHLCILWQRTGLWIILIFMWGITTLLISSKLTKITSSHLYPWMNHANYSEIAFEFGSWMYKKNHSPSSEQGIKSGTRPGYRSLAYFCGTSRL